MTVFLRFLGIALLAALALSACQRSSSPDASPSAFKGIDLTGASYARKLDLTDADGKPRTLADFKGKVVVVFFGYTHCPDVCPTTMAELAELKRSLGADGARLQGVFVTLDPERDTAAVLKAYVTGFDPSFVALRGSESQLKAVAQEFKIYYAKVPGREDGSYTLDHTAGSYLFDDQGRVRVFERYGNGALALANDVKVLLAAR